MCRWFRFECDEFALLTNTASGHDLFMLIWLNQWNVVDREKFINYNSSAAMSSETKYIEFNGNMFIGIFLIDESEKTAASFQSEFRQLN